MPSCRGIQFLICIPEIVLCFSGRFCVLPMWQNGRSWEKRKKWSSIFLIYESPIQQGMPTKTRNHKVRSECPTCQSSFLLPLFISYWPGLKTEKSLPYDFIPSNKHCLRKYLGDDPFEDQLAFSDLIIPITKKETFFSFADIYRKSALS